VAVAAPSTAPFGVVSTPPNWVASSDISS
jgi:hypothetical protein